jgi:phosphatidylglycerol:prolipoprotein diacylglycerol transferase
MHPILFQLGPLTLRSYGLMMALGFLFGIILTLFFTRKEGRQDEMVLDLCLWIMLGAIVGARLLYVIVMPESYLKNPMEIFEVWEGGLVYYGGLIGASLTAYFWMRRHQVPVWELADCLAPGLALGQMFGRLGCFLNGCCYGQVSPEHGLIFPAVGDGLPHLPTQLYEAAFVLALAIFLSWFRKHRAYAGQVFWIYVALYAVGRFVLEIYRGDVERGVLLSNALSPGQWISVLGLGLALAAHFRMMQRKTTP